MDSFFKVTSLSEVLEYRRLFTPLGTETVDLAEAPGRILGADLVSDEDLPPFSRSTMDGFAVRAASTFGASEANPAFLTLKGEVAMGQVPEFSIGPGEAARIATGGALPAGSDAVVMLEYAEILDEQTIEVTRSVAPGGHVVEKGEDFSRGQVVLGDGRRLRAQEVGLLAAFGRGRVTVFRRPVVGIISTGDEIVSIEETPGPGQIRDVNTYTLTGQVLDAGGHPVSRGIVRDRYDSLKRVLTSALDDSDMVLISGGSSVGTRDYTLKVFSDLPEAEVLVHGMTISPGKPTILARVGQKPVWGLPGHVASAMVVFTAVVRPFLERIGGLAGRADSRPLRIPARMARNVASAQGRVEFIRVRLRQEGDRLLAEPVLGKSGLIHTMVRADGLVTVGMNEEGLEKGDPVEVIPM
ncbi:MAG: molybdopterin molybdotransferase MoeA [Desulfobacterales bacterium]|jgi:molybdopterin molybdotransferase